MRTSLQPLGSLDVPPLALGAMRFGTSVTEAVAHRCLDVAVDLGIGFWDTANNYAFWAGGTGDESETTLGRWFSQRGPRARDGVVLATKVGARPRPGYADLGHVLGLSPQAIRAQVVDCLRRLRTDRIDLLYAHLDDRAVPVADTLEAMGCLIDEGLVREIGASNFTLDRWREAVTVPTDHPYRGLQQRFTLLPPVTTADFAPQVVLDQELEASCAAHGVRMLGYSPLLSGAYTRPDKPVPARYLRPETQETLAVVRRCGAEVGLDAGQVVLAWSIQRSRSVVPIVGISRPEHVVSAAAALPVLLPASVLELLENVHRDG